jgi:DNA polymerase-3 subunit delta
MTPKELFADISTGKFKPVYYFYGTETYRRIEAEKFIARQFLPDRQLTTNYRRIDGNRCSCSDLVAHLSVYPMIGERQVISVSDFQRYKPTEIGLVLRLLGDADPTRVVVLSSPESKTPKRSSTFFKKITGFAECVEFRKISTQEAAYLMKHKLTKAELTVQPDALQLLVELVAGNRGALEVEVNKLIDYIGVGESVTSEHVRKLATGFQVYSVFDLADEVTDGSTTGALRQIRQLLAEGNSPTGILFFLGQHFISLYLVKNGKPLEPHRRFLTSKFKRQAAKYTTERIEEIICWIAETDAAIRQGKLKAEILLEQLVLNLMGVQD